MISVINAKKEIISNIISAPIIQLALDQLSGQILASDFRAKFDSPDFRQAAMDGYAYIKSEHKLDFVVRGESKAGEPFKGKIQNNETINIYTGAKVPDDVDTIVPVEFIEKNGEIITIKKEIKKGANIREIGSQFKKEEILIEKGTKLKASHIALLAMNGVTDAEVYKKPNIAIIVTGSELKKPGETLIAGEIYESNSIMLKTALAENHYNNIAIIQLNDNYDLIKQRIQDVLVNYDFVLLSGGMSVGKYDYVRKALTECRVSEIFYKVKQKPGKPFYFGKTAQTYVFGLPGNPGAALTCLYEYVIIGLNKFTGRTIVEREKNSVICTNEYSKEAGLTHFLKGFYKNNTVTILEEQESYKIKPFAEANCFIEIGEEITQVKQGDLVKIQLFYNND